MDIAFDYCLVSLRRYVNDKDLAFFKYHAVEDGACEGASPWQLMMNKDIPGFVKYTSWRRTLPSGKTEYKSVTISPNATAREFSDLYLDDDFRRNWVSTACQTESCWSRLSLGTVTCFWR